MFAFIQSRDYMPAIIGDDEEKKERIKIINSLSEYIEYAGMDEKKRIASTIYNKHPEQCQEKGAGLQIKLKNLSSDFLLSLMEKDGERQDLPFWETLGTS